MSDKKRITLAQYHAHEGLSDGYCLECEAWTAEGVEPDARRLKCPVCEQCVVFGAMEAVVSGLVEVVP